MAAFNPRISGATIVSRVLKSIGLPVPSSPAGATDAISVQIWALLTELGQELMSLYDWQIKSKTLVIVTDPLITQYALPDDFVRFVDDTDWNMTARIPLMFVNPVQWAELKARNLGGTTLWLQYRINNNKLELYYSPSAAQTFNLQYLSRGWVQDGSVPTTFKDTMENDSDICLFDPRLIVSMLRFRWRQAKGFNTTDLEEQYKHALIQAQNDDVPGQDLNLSVRGDMYPYLNYYNIPDTGYGH